MDDLEILREKILRAAEALCSQQSLVLVELTVRGFNQNVAIELLVDLPLGGVGIEECSRLNRSLDQELYESMKLGDNYTLEVSSPGLDRPLKSVADFRRSIGKKVNFFLREKIGGKMQISGSIREVLVSEVVVITKTGDITLSVDTIEKGLIVIA